MTTTTGTLSSAGLGSGLDINGLVTKLMAVESQPLTQLQQKEASYQAKLTAYGSLSGALSAYQNSLGNLKNAATFSALKANIIDSTVATVSASTTAVAGSHLLKVTQLAQAQSVNSGTFTNTTDVVGTGTISIQFGTYDSGGNTFTANPDKSTQTITIASGNQTLAGVRDAINAANAGVTATIANDGTGNRLLITSKDSGLANSLKITVADDDGNNTNTSGLSKLAFDPTALVGAGKNLTQSQAPLNATFSVDGLSITSASNTVTTAIQGVTLNLLKTTDAAGTNINVTQDTSSLLSALNSFVQGYNNFRSTISTLTAYDPQTKQGGILLGDSTALNIDTRLRSLLSSAVQGADSSYTTLSTVGISFQKNGTLSFDTTKASAAIAANSSAVSKLFAAVGTSSDSLVSYIGSSKNTVAGSYAVNVSQLATQGKLVGAQAAGLTVTDSVDNTVQFTIDGISANVILTSKTYASASELASELQTKINSNTTLANSGIQVAVTESAGVFTVTAQDYGTNSKVLVTAGAGATNLFGNAPTSTEGVNVAGTINGVAATGSAQTLTSTEGLRINILGGATGNRGTVTYSSGYANQVDQLITQYVSSDGIIAARTSGINTSIKGLESQAEQLSKRLDTIEARYRAQFTALDQAIASMNSTSTFLTQQINNFPSNKKS